MPGLFDGTPLEQPVTCEHCGKALDACACPRGADGGVVLPGDQQARVRREKRRGKHMTVITGLDRDASDVGSLCRELRKLLATGGSVTSDGAIELQGDHRDRLVELLRARGYPAKAAGG